MALDRVTIEVIRRHSPLGRTLLVGGADSVVVEPQSFLESCGANEIAVVDMLQPSFGKWLRQDLNLPFDLDCQYDTVIDNGTIEHIANIGQCLKTEMLATKVGGTLIIQTVTDSNQMHGFYQLSPHIFVDMFVPENGWSLLELRTYRVGSTKSRLEPIDCSQQLRLHLPRYIVAVAKKVVGLPLVWPMQTLWKGPWVRAKKQPVKNALKLCAYCLKP